ncbi:MAG TPA: hypothetical protein VG518_04415 [Solirubrobacterales bacterium]|nr:hypothetical protein [Solirubrobacterales bacterium]
MAFVLGSIGLVFFLVGVLVVVGHFYRGPNADLVDWYPTRSPEVEAQNEIDDVRQMIEAQNAMRARRGAPALDESALREEVEAEELEALRWRER